MLFIGALYCVFLWAIMWVGFREGMGGVRRRHRQAHKEQWEEQTPLVAEDTLGTQDATDVVVALFPADYRDAFLMDEDAKESSREVVRAQVRAAESAAGEPLASRIATRNREALELACSRQRRLKKMM
jgi:hypothetical protein